MMKKLIGIFEIILIFLSGISFSYIMSQTNSIESISKETEESKTIIWLREKTLDYLSNGLVSAQAIQTCLTDKDGSICQEYTSDVCTTQCTTQCFPGRRNDYTECKLGVCYDSSFGVCSFGSPKSYCENGGGEWSENTPVQCNRGCCLINPDGNGGANQARFTTSQECNYLGQTRGANIEWDGQIAGEIQCLSKIRTKKEGACVLDLIEELNKNNCKFVTEVNCLSLGGTFYDGQLCTNPQLNTKCEITQNTKCFDSKDGVYFIDSCENRANIYNSLKINNVEYWSRVVPLSQSCNLGTGSNPLSNQQKCGNCNYISGSICGNPQLKIDDNPVYGKYVCKDLSCIDIDGTKKEHGESWCAFDGQIGTDGEDGTNEERAVDVVGSRNYRKLCYNGEIRLEPCAEYRNGICVENKADKNGLSNAQCRVNTGSLCLKYNENEESLAKCEESPDCFLKHFKVDKMEFDVCAPKYPVGFELNDAPNTGAQTICALATQTCTYYEKKGINGKWSCKVNCECKEAGFAEKMNNICMSLGDCGAHVNLAGEIGTGYSTKGDRSPKISQAYIEGLKKYIKPLKGQRVSSLPNSEAGAQQLFGESFSLDIDDTASKISQFGLGAAGLLSLYTSFSGLSATALPAGFIGPATEAQASAASWVGFSNVLNAGAVGAGIGYIMGMIFGLEGDDLTIAVVVGAASGVAAAFGLFGDSIAGLIIDPWTLIVVVVISVILNILGIGKYREKKVEFSCLPWQPPSGGDNCSKCKEYGIECTQYKCKSLGKTCELLNAETDNELCVNIAPDDSLAPEIKFNSSSLSGGLSYEETQNGVKISNSSSSNGCLMEYSLATFGINLNEAAQCKISTVDSSSYEEMEETFFDSSSNSYAYNHQESVAMATLDSLGVSGVDPNRVGDYNLYVRCEDKSGNSNDAGYNIRFCVSPANDLQPPVITRFIPESPALIGLNSDSFNLKFYTNEPATCKFGDSDQSYETMPNEAVCHNDITQSTLYGWLCLARLNATQEDNSYYLRCADQPWLGSDFSNDGVTPTEGINVNTQSTEYKVLKTTTPLVISSATPNGETILSGTEPVSVTIDVSTTGGMDNGKAFCSYTLNNAFSDSFSQTGLSNHKQTWTSLFANDHNVKIRCVDRAGNLAEGEINFKVEVDNIGPIITRVYNSGDKLQIITNEPSVCEYSISSCSFDFGSGTTLGGAGKTHTMQYSNGQTYRIKCRDSFGNAGSCLSVTGGY